MMKGTEGKKNISGLIVLLILGIFAVCVVSVILSGVETYKGINDRDRNTFDERTCSQYITTKVRQAKSPESIKTLEFNDGAALTFTDNIDGEEYVTYVYCYEGWLCEYFGDANSGSPDEVAEFGEKLIQIEEFEPTVSDGLVKIKFKSNDEAEYIKLNIFIRAGEEEHNEE